MVDDLVHRQQREVDRHQLDDRAQAGHRRADAHADDRVLGDRRVAHALLAELLEQPGGDLEGAVEDADVLAHQEHVLVALHLLAQRLVERLAVAHDGHQRSSSAPRRRRPRPAPRRSPCRPDVLARACSTASLVGAPPARARPRPCSRSCSPRCTPAERSSTEYQPLHLVAEHVDVVVERLGRRERRLVGERDRLVDALDDRLVDLLRPRPPRARPPPRAAAREDLRSGRACATRRPAPWCGTPRGRPSSGRGSGR